MTLAALEATLRIYLEGRGAELPLWQMALAPDEELERRALALAGDLRERLGSTFKIEPTRLMSVAGGGSLPGAELHSWGISIAHAERSTAELQRNLRYVTPPVIARVEDARLLLDLRTVSPSDDAALLDLLAEGLGASSA